MALTHATGYLPSGHATGSTKEPIYGDFKGPIPDSVSWLPFLHDTRDQTITSSCVGQAIAHACYIRQGIEAVKDRRFPSARFIYYVGRANYGHEKVDMGMIPSIAMSALAKEGFPAEEDFPFDPAKINDPIPWGVGQAAYDQRIAESYRINSFGDARVQEIKKALAAGYPVIYGTVVDKAFDNYSGGLLQDPVGTFEGRHMLCLFGYNAEGGLGINSWGRSWGEAWDEDSRSVGGGLYRVSWDTLAGPYTDDFWVFTTVPGIAKVGG